MNNKKNTQIKLNKTIYITFIIVVLFYSISFCDIGSISPTIGNHIHPDQCKNEGRNCPEYKRSDKSNIKFTVA